MSLASHGASVCAAEVSLWYWQEPANWYKLWLGPMRLSQWQWVHSNSLSPCVFQQRRIVCHCRNTFAKNCSKQGSHMLPSYLIHTGFTCIKETLPFPDSVLLKRLSLHCSFFFFSFQLHPGVITGENTKNCSRMASNKWQCNKQICSSAPQVVLTHQWLVLFTRSNTSFCWAIKGQ